MRSAKIENTGLEAWRGVALILLQMDIEGHSQWFRETQKREAINAKADFADKVSDLMREQEFQLVYWAGDGGMYACDPTKLPSYDRAVDAARAIAKKFQHWRSQNRNRARLRIRISIHCGFPVYVHDEPGYWASDHLNAFAKHERDIAIAGTIAITDAVRENLAPEVAVEFPESTRRQVLIGSAPGEPALIRYVYYSPIKGEGAELRRSQHSFGAWMEQLCDDIGLASSTEVGPQSAIRAVVGEAMVLQFAPGPGATIVVKSKRPLSPSGYDLTSAERAALDQSADDLHRQSLELVGRLSRTLPLFTLGKRQ